MKTIHWNGEHWYADETPLARRILSRVIWIGGWDHWDTTRHRRRWDILWPRSNQTFGGRPWYRRFHSPTPVSVGSRFTYFGWGWQFRIGGGYLVYTRKRFGEAWRRTCYWSPDGTPARATSWFTGWSHDVEHAAQVRSPVRTVAL